MIFYLTFNDSPSGLYSSQVIDVVKFISSQFNAEIRLVAFISIRSFSENKKRILSELPNAIVLPMVPGVKRWRLNTIALKWLCFFYKPATIIARSVLATQLAFGTKCKNIVYDGRGAIAAEWREYRVIEDKRMLEEITELERQAVLNSQYRIAVSEHLVSFWREEYNYGGSQHVIIPCTLNRVFEEIELNEGAINAARSRCGFKESDLVFVYSGSVAGWQSFELLHSFIAPRLKTDRNIRLFFLADADKNIQKLKSEYPEQVMYKKVSAQEVPLYLMAADYGLLIREETVTNKVASPIKFAEYLVCGLKVIISDHLGDYTEYVKSNKCGFLFNTSTDLKRGSIAERNLIRQIALRDFTKMSCIKKYASLIN
jgi:glycosyltransferase involved in cell wall biosynthesis